MAWTSGPAAIYWASAADCLGSQVFSLRPGWYGLHAGTCRRGRACQDTAKLFVPVGQVDRGECVCAPMYLTSMQQLTEESRAQEPSCCMTQELGVLLYLSPFRVFPRLLSLFPLPFPDP